MELVNDNDNKVKLFIDERVLNTEYFRFHPNENGLTIRIRYERTLYVEKNADDKKNLTAIYKIK